MSNPRFDSFKAALRTLLRDHGVTLSVDTDDGTVLVSDWAYEVDDEPVGVMLWNDSLADDYPAWVQQRRETVASSAQSRFAAREMARDIEEGRELTMHVTAIHAWHKTAFAKTTQGIEILVNDWVPGLKYDELQIGQQLKGLVGRGLELIRVTQQGAEGHDIQGC